MANTAIPKGADKKKAKPLNFTRTGNHTVRVEKSDKSVSHLSPKDFEAQYDVVTEDKEK